MRGKCREAYLLGSWRLWAGWPLLIAAGVLGALTDTVFLSLVSLTIGMIGFGLIDQHHEIGERTIVLVKVRDRRNGARTLVASGREHCHTLPVRWRGRSR